LLFVYEFISVCSVAAARPDRDKRYTAMMISPISQALLTLTQCGLGQRRLAGS
jgi:hypothetical protein